LKKELRFLFWVFVDSKKKVAADPVVGAATGTSTVHPDIRPADLAGFADNAYATYREARLGIRDPRRLGFKSFVADAHDRGLRVFVPLELGSRHRLSPLAHFFQFRDPTTDSCLASMGKTTTVAASPT
jgi:hypothetical protein